jgi:hypothetical protein
MSFLDNLVDNFYKNKHLYQNNMVSVLSISTSVTFSIFSSRFYTIHTTNPILYIIYIYF